MSEVRKKPFRLTAPKPFIPREYDEQVAVFEYAQMAERRDPRWGLLFATLNGVRLPISLAVKMKRAGMRADIPDIILPVRVPADPFCDGRSSWGGLWIEMKRVKGGVVSEGQKWYHEALRQQGYKVEVAKGAKNAIEIIEKYLAG